MGLGVANCGISLRDVRLTVSAALGSLFPLFPAGRVNLRRLILLCGIKKKIERLRKAYTRKHIEFS